MTDPNHLIDRYLDGQLTPEEIAQLESDLRDTPGHADDFAKAMLIDTLLKEKYEWETLISVVDDPDAGEQSGRHETQRIEFWPNLAYVFAKGSRKIVRSQSAWLAAAAAVIILVLWLVNPFAPGPPADPADADAPTADQGSLAPVATLTGMRNAKWGQQPGEDFYVGSALYPGDRLTLTEGFAEITTKDGAVAILQAPATVELLENHNAIRLHKGKLVGICETEDSKGFLVHTPYSDIIDVGTVFGVWVDASNRVITRVIEGRVDVRLPGQHQTGNVVQRLVAGQAARVDASGAHMVGVDADDATFRSLVTQHMGVRAVSGQVVLGPSPLSAPDARLSMELPHHRLEADIEVSTGSIATQNRVTLGSGRSVVASGTAIRSYALVFSPRRESACRGRITFSGRVLGVIVQDQQADRFAAALGSDAVFLDAAGRRMRWPELTGATALDTLRILDDGYTIEFQFNAHHIDAMRIITQVPARLKTELISQEDASDSP